MAFQLPPLPSFQTNIPQYNPLEAAQLRNLLSEMALRQALAPGQLQQQQQQLQQQQIQNQLMQAKADSQKAMIKMWSDPDVSEGVTGHAGDTANIGFNPGFDPVAMIRKFVRGGVSPEDAIQQAAHFLAISKDQSQKTKDDLANYKDAHAAAAQILDPILDLPLEKAGPAFQAALQKIQRIPGIDPNDVQLLARMGLEHLPAALGYLGFVDDIAAHHQKQAEAFAATPEGKAKIAGAEAQARLNVESSPQGLRLAASRAALEANARQSAAQGDPASAGQLLASGQLTLNDLKSRGTTPKFITQAVAAAQKISPNYNPADEVISESVAKSPQANQFFGSANSLIGKGGTLDQLEQLGKLIPQHDFPVLNSVSDWQNLARGKGPLAAYAATALGVADDYGKVMGGGNASDHARDAALQLFGQAASPDQRAQAIAATRNAVQSQRDSRIGNNQFLKRQYAVEVSKGSSRAAGPPAGATMRVPGSDGKMHWSDGKSDLGVAE